MKNKEIRKGLENKGWIVEERTNHIFLEFVYEGRKTGIKTFLSRGTKEYSKYLLSQIKKQLKFSNENELKKYIKCKLSNEDYIKILKTKNII